MGRLDRGWERLPADKRTLQKPSVYQKRLYYDTVTSSEEALRFLLDTVGAERVVLGSDWPFVPYTPGPGGWVQSLNSLTRDEKDKILWKNLEALLKL
jgi:aminocarboxymuconate-semialdehyde decarboxylase